MFFVSHKICDSCGEIGHKRDMVKTITHGFRCRAIAYYHSECYEIKYGVRPCPCGEGYIPIHKYGGRK